MTVVFEKAVAADEAYLIQLRLDSMGDHLRRAGISLTEEEHLSRVRECFESCYLIFWAGQRAGMIKCHEVPEKVNVVQLQISPDCQGQGVGKKVLEKVMSDAARHNKMVILSVLKENPALRLYQRLGFVAVGEDADEIHMQWQP